MLSKPAMSNPQAALPGGRPESQPEKLVEGRYLRWFEVCLVMLVALAGFFLNSLNLLQTGPGAAPRVSNFRWLIGVVNEVNALLLLGYVLSRRGRRFRDLGLRWSLRDVGVGLIVTAVSFLSYLVGSIVLQTIHFAMYGTLVTGHAARAIFTSPSTAAVPFFLLSPFFEELIVRAYLMTEIVELTRSATLAVIVSVAVQVSYHLYYGWLGALSIGCQVLIFALYYARWHRALPVIVAHGLFDLYGLIRLW